MAERERIQAASDLLFRQVHPEWIQDGQPSSQAFRPTPKDDGQMSTSWSSKTDPQGSYDCHVGKGYASVGVWGVSVGECNAEDLSAFHEPEQDDEAHSLVDYRAKNGNQLRNVSRRLKRQALERGCLYPPEPA